MHRNFTTLSIDNDTKSRLVRLAQSKPQAEYLRDLLKLMEHQELPQVAVRLEAIERKLDGIDAYLKPKAERTYLQLADGRLKVSARDSAPMLDELYLKSELEKNPNATQVGWYNLLDGEWVFDTERYLVWEGAFNALLEEGHTKREADEIMRKREAKKESKGDG